MPARCLLDTSVLFCFNLGVERLTLWRCTVLCCTLNDFGTSLIYKTIWQASEIATIFTISHLALQMGQIFAIDTLLPHFLTESNSSIFRSHILHVNNSIHSTAFHAPVSPAISPKNALKFAALKTTTAFGLFD